jgi:dTDP-4-amino-4,6-dideoxygalactose transaminase
MSFNSVFHLEDKVSKFFGSSYAVATDCCTHAIELCLRLKNIKKAVCPKRTYISIPFTFEKLGLEWQFEHNLWQDYYYVADNIIDAAVYWQENSYIPHTYMCLSFQYKKHLGLGRGGAILLDAKDDYLKLKKMSYDGRMPDIPWADQNIDTIGYHYYMTPETAELGLEKLPSAISKNPTRWSYQDYPDLSTMEIFYGQ